MYSFYKWKINPMSETKIFTLCLLLAFIFHFLKVHNFHMHVLHFLIMTMFWSPPEGGHLYDMKVKCSSAFVRSYYERLVSLNLFLCYTAYAKRACGWLLKSKNAWVKQILFVSLNLNHFKYKTIGRCSQQFLMSVSGFIHVLQTLDLFYIE